jgi:hypothetical protein
MNRISNRAAIIVVVNEPKITVIIVNTTKAANPRQNKTRPLNEK